MFTQALKFNAGAARKIYIQLGRNNKVTHCLEGYPSDLRSCHSVAKPIVEVLKIMVFFAQKGLPNLFARPCPTPKL